VPQATSIPRGTSELEFTLQCLREVEGRAQSKINEVVKQIGDLRRRSDERDEEFHDELARCLESLENLRTAVNDMTSAILRHIQSDADRNAAQSIADRDRDSSLSKLETELALLAVKSGKKAGHESGAAAGRAVARRWGGLFTAIGVGLSMILSTALQRCTEQVSSQKTPQKHQTNESQ
jgi:hypothetical protein